MFYLVLDSGQIIDLNDEDIYYITPDQIEEMVDRIDPANYKVAADAYHDMNMEMILAKDLSKGPEDG